MLMCVRGRACESVCACVPSQKTKTRGVPDPRGGVCAGLHLPTPATPPAGESQVRGGVGMGGRQEMARSAGGRSNQAQEGVSLGDLLFVVSVVRF